MLKGVAPGHRRVIVVDASALVHALIAVSANSRLLALLAVEDLCAPHLIDFEVANALRGQVIAGKLPSPRRGGAYRVRRISD